MNCPFRLIGQKHRSMRTNESFHLNLIYQINIDIIKRRATISNHEKQSFIIQHSQALLDLKMSNIETYKRHSNLICQI